MKASPLIGVDSFRDLIVSDTPLIDVRAPIEFERGALPAAINLPILDDEERHQVGLLRRKQGSAAAVKLGHTLVSGQTKEDRIQAWVSAQRTHPAIALYCARGGQRSQIACDWLKEAGCAIPRIDGGYKALRRYLLEELANVPTGFTLSGWTGVGKTETIESLSCAIDLEGIANHRGSAFGGMLHPQPVQRSFENAVAIEFIKFRARGDKHLVMEDESRLIGRIHLGTPIIEALRKAPILLQEASLAERIHRIHQDYILSNWKDFQTCDPEALAPLLSDGALPATLSCLTQPFATFASRLLRSLDAIRKRLGGLRHAQLREDMVQALMEHQAGDPEGHRRWIESLLVEYYDPMYRYQIARKEKRIVFRGTKDEIIDWLQVRS